MPHTTALLWILAIIINMEFYTVNGIGCYVCSSINGSNPLCEDPFNSYTEAYQSSCEAARKGRTGLFPATECIKFKAVKGDHTIMVRNCALDNGGITKDMEIGLIDHCGWSRDIRYNDQPMKGCLVVCSADGCNLCSAVTYSALLTLLSTLVHSLL